MVHIKAKNELYTGFGNVVAQQDNILIETKALVDAVGMMSAGYFLQELIKPTLQSNL